MNESSIDNQDPYKIFFINKSTEGARQIELSNLKKIDYEIWAITYFERKNGFERIVDINVDYWLSENEIEKKNFLIANKDNLLGYYANDPGLKLQLSPSKDSDVIVIIKRDLYEILPTGQTG